MFGYVM